MENLAILNETGTRMLKLHAGKHTFRLTLTVALVVAISIPLSKPAYASFGAGNGGCGDSAAAAIIACGTSLPGLPGAPGGHDRAPVHHAQPAAGRSPTAERPATSTTSSIVCRDVRATQIYAPPPPGSNPDGAWYFRQCSGPNYAHFSETVLWLSPPAANSPPPAAAVPPVPGSAGAAAASLLRLPSPILGMNPSATGYVNLPEWLWVDPVMWHPFTTAASACSVSGCSSASATATPVEVAWTMGNGAVVDCNGPGTAYNPAVPVADQTPSCSYTYAETSLGQASPDGNPNDAAYRVTATVVWSVTWSADGTTGTLPDLTTSASTWLRVAQIQSVVTAGTRTQP